MKAEINGIWVEGTPEEIAEYSSYVKTDGVKYDVKINIDKLKGDLPFLSTVCTPTICSDYSEGDCCNCAQFKCCHLESDEDVEDFEQPDFNAVVRMKNGEVNLFIYEQDTFKEFRKDLKNKLIENLHRGIKLVGLGDIIVSVDEIETIEPIRQ